jgi:hypothetical protein
MLKVPKVNRTKRPAAATKTESKVTHNASKAAEAGILISAIRHADDPIQRFNECMFFISSISFSAQDIA